MTDTQTPKAKLTDKQFANLMYQIIKIRATLNDMFHMVSEIQNEREHDDSYYEDLDKIWDAIRYGQEKIIEMREMFWEVME